MVLIRKHKPRVGWNTALEGCISYEATIDSGSYE